MRRFLMCVAFTACQCIAHNFFTSESTHKNIIKDRMIFDNPIRMAIIINS